MPSVRAQHNRKLLEGRRPVKCTEPESCMNRGGKQHTCSYLGSCPKSGRMAFVEVVQERCKKGNVKCRVFKKGVVQNGNVKIGLYKRGA